MVVGTTLELPIVLGTILFSILLLVIIDRIGAVRGPIDDDEEEV